MSDQIEIINPQNMTGAIYLNGVVVDRYKVEQCDLCLKLMRKDTGHYVPSDPAELMIWLCAPCAIERKINARERD